MSTASAKAKSGESPKENPKETSKANAKAATAAAGGKTRIEKDSMGEFAVPSSAYYGAQTMRAVVNFPISGLRFPRAFVRAMGEIKGAAAAVNLDLGNIPESVARAIEKAAAEVAEGKFDAEFAVDIFQTGSGTSTNMNANEVIANRAIEILGGVIGSKKPVHPNDHVNFGQSSNDVIPTAIHLSALMGLHEHLMPALARLQSAFRVKSKQFWGIIKTGRTHLQDATPVRLGQEFRGYEGQAERAVLRLAYAVEDLSEVALGGTAVGTGVNTHPEFSKRVCDLLTRRLGFTVRETENHFQEQSTIDAVVFASGALKSVAVSLLKIANDIRWLGSGPRAGIGELALPEVQPGSSIMPGKVNPVIAESLAMVCAQVIGNDAAITIAGQSGNFELNVMMPVAARNLLDSIAYLGAAVDNFRTKCIEGIEATTRGPEMVERGLMTCTSLAPVIGYEQAAAIAKKAAKTGRTIREVALEETKLTRSDMEKILDPAGMTEPGLGKGPAGG